MNKKIYLDNLKVFSLLLVSVYFFSEVGFSIQNNHELTYNLIRLVSNLAFPMLLMVFGVCTLNKHSNWFESVKENYSYLIPPFIIWNVILAIFVVFFYGFESFVTNVTTPNWFIWIILSNALIIPIINEFIKREGDNGIIYILALFLFTGILWSLSVQFDFSMYYIDLVFFAQPLCFMVLGYYLDNHVFSMSSKKLVVLLIIVLAITLLIRCLLIINGINSYDSYFVPLFKSSMPICIDPFTLISVSCIFLIFKSIVGFKDNSVINFYSKISYNYLLVLSIIVIIFSNLNLKFNLLTMTLFGTLFSFIFIGIFLFILKKIPYIGKLCRL